MDVVTGLVIGAHATTYFTESPVASVDRTCLQQRDSEQSYRDPQHEGLLEDTRAQTHLHKGKKEVWTGTARINTTHCELRIVPYILCG